jgi:hypothetical protein
MDRRLDLAERRQAFLDRLAALKEAIQAVS